MTEEQSSRLESLGIDLSETDLAGDTIEEKFDALNINLDDFSDEQIHPIYNGLADLTVEAVSMYADPDLDPNQMGVIFQGLFDDAVSHEDVELYANPEFTAGQMSSILEAARDPNISHEDLETYANSDFTEAQLNEIFTGLDEGIDVSTYADPDLSTNEMYSVRNALENNLGSENLVDNIKDGESKLESIVNGDTSITEISVWNVENTNDYEVGSSGIPDFNDTHYFISTEDGDFEVRVAWDRYNSDEPYSISVYENIDDGNGGDEHILIYDSVYDESDSSDVLDKIRDTISEGSVDVEERNIRIDDVGIGEDADGEPQFEFVYTIDGDDPDDPDERIHVYADDFDASIHDYDPITRFCEENKDSLANLSTKDYESRNFDSMDDFKEAVGNISEDEEDIDAADLADLEDTMDFDGIIDETLETYQEQEEPKEQGVETKPQDNDVEQKENSTEIPVDNDGKESPVDNDSEQDKADADEQDDNDDNNDWNDGWGGDGVD